MRVHLRIKCVLLGRGLKAACESACQAIRQLYEYSFSYE